jgi:hypothetical protein
LQDRVNAVDRGELYGRHRARLEGLRRSARAVPRLRADRAREVSVAARRETTARQPADEDDTEE